MESSDDQRETVQSNGLSQIEVDWLFIKPFPPSERARAFPNTSGPPGVFDSNLLVTRAVARCMP